MELQWQPHPIAELFPKMTPEQETALKQDMMQRALNGLDPLEQPILLYEGKILDGRHRVKMWFELANEDACNGYFKRNLPRTETFSPEKHGNLAAFLRAKSRNLVHRGMPAYQKVAILLDAAEKFPELNAALNAIAEENLKRRQEGKPLDAGDQRGNTAEQIGKLTGVGATTVKDVQRLKKKAPAKFKEILQGKKTAKRALKEIAKREQKVKAVRKWKEQPAAEGPYKRGDTFFRVCPNTSSFPPGVKLVAYRVEAVRDDAYLTSDGESIPKFEALTLETATSQYVAIIERLLTELAAAAKQLRARLKHPLVEDRGKENA
jgi:hypothetical protein